jgi:hypothetical protein
MRRGLLEVKTFDSRSSALLRRVTSPDQYRFLDRRVRLDFSVARTIALAFPFEVLDRTLMLLRGLPRWERPQVPALACARIALARIEAVIA